MPASGATEERYRAELRLRRWVDRATIALPMTIAPNDFTHLHVHSEFSLLDGLGRITELVDAAAQAGMDSMAVTDA